MPPPALAHASGRALPARIRALRAKAGSFLDLCYDPEMAAEASLQPLHRFALDGVILFSDILVVAEALGVKLWFEEGEGPRPEAIRRGDTLPQFDAVRHRRHLAPVYEAMERVVAAAPGGRPFWVSQAHHGRSSRTWSAAEGAGTLLRSRLGLPRAREFCATDGDGARGGGSAFDRPARTPGPMRCRFRQLGGHIAGEGARALVYRARRSGWSADVKAVHPRAPIIGYPRGAGVLYERFAAETGVDAVSIDSTVPPAWAAAHLQPHCTVQGNLDPVALMAGGEAQRSAACRIMRRSGTGLSCSTSARACYQRLRPPTSPRSATWCTTGPKAPDSEPRGGGPDEPRRAGLAGGGGTVPAEPVSGPSDHPRARASALAARAHDFEAPRAGGARYLPRDRRALAAPGGNRGAGTRSLLGARRPGQGRGHRRDAPLAPDER